MSKKVIYCNCKGNIIDPQKWEAIEAFVASSGLTSFKVTDLCGICSTDKEEATRLFSAPDDLLIIACYPRAVKLLLDFAGVEAESKPLTYINFRDTDDENLCNQIKSFAKGELQASSLHELQSEPEWPSWFPMIDYSRCTSCGQCAEFCLFGVYEKSDGKVLVVNPKGCKNNCPACARICPQTAIVFPKYQQGGAIAGASSIDDTAEQQRQREDVDTILGSDIYKALEQRKAKRHAIIKAEAMNKALEERDKAIHEKQKKN